MHRITKRVTQVRTFSDRVEQISQPREPRCIGANVGLPIGGLRRRSISINITQSHSSLAVEEKMELLGPISGGGVREIRPVYVSREIRLGGMCWNMKSWKFEILIQEVEIGIVADRV